MLWSDDPVKLFEGKFFATLAAIVTDINCKTREGAPVASRISPLAGRLKAALEKHVAPLPAQISGVIDRVEAVGERAGHAITNVRDAVGVVEGLLHEVEQAEQAVTELLEVIPQAEAVAPIPMPLLSEQRVAVPAGAPEPTPVPSNLPPVHEPTPVPSNLPPAGLLPGWEMTPDGPRWGGSSIPDAGGRGDHPSMLK